MSDKRVGFVVGLGLVAVVIAGAAVLRHRSRAVSTSAAPSVAPERHASTGEASVAGADTHVAPPRVPNIGALPEIPTEVTPSSVPPATETRTLPTHPPLAELPRTLAEADKSQAAVESLETARRSDPMLFNLVERRVAFLAALDACLAGRVHGPGSVSLVFGYDVDTKTLMGTGSSVEISNSTLPEAEDEVFLGCARKAHAGSPLQLVDDPGGPSYFNPTTIEIPLDRNPVYEFLHTGRW